MPKVSVQYFAILREQRGLTHEEITTSAPTAGQFYDELRAQHRFTLPQDRVRAAINGEFVTAAAPLSEGDKVVFIPPVAGG